jgi:hypothetical protein
MGQVAATGTPAAASTKSALTLTLLNTAPDAITLSPGPSTMGPPTSTSPFGEPATINPSAAVILPPGHQIELGNLAGAPPADDWVIFDSSGSPAIATSELVNMMITNSDYTILTDGDGYVIKTTNAAGNSVFLFVPFDPYGGQMGGGIPAGLYYNPQLQLTWVNDPWQSGRYERGQNIGPDPPAGFQLVSLHTGSF